MTAYYNENDPKAAAWLRELIAANLIAPGDVDERSIEDVRPADLAGYRQCHFFAGIGGWSYALRLAGVPDHMAVWTGSCPCQPFSAAGARKGTDDERHLWPAFRWLIDQCRPPVVFGEQVASKAGRAWLAGVRADLEAMAYGVGAADLCAAGVGAPHIRQRLWWVADTKSERCRGRVARESGENHERGRAAEISGSSEFGGVADSEGHGDSLHARHPQERELQARGDADGCRYDGGLGDPGSQGLQKRERDGRVQREAGQPSEGQAAELPSNAGGLGDTKSSGRSWDELSETARESALRAKAPSVWDEYVWLPCADGKARRIEPGIEPLVDGLPGRVGLLRGYGNAIVPQVAAEFVRAWLDTEASQ